MAHDRHQACALCHVAPVPPQSDPAPGDGRPSRWARSPGSPTRRGSQIRLIGADGQLHAVIVGVHAVALIAVGEIQLVAFRRGHPRRLPRGRRTPAPWAPVAIAFEGVGARLIIIVKDGVNLIFQIGAAPSRARLTTPSAANGTRGIVAPSIGLLTLMSVTVNDEGGIPSSTPLGRGLSAQLDQAPDASLSATAARRSRRPSR